jgi:hypothetical protein
MHTASLTPFCAESVVRDDEDDSEERIDGGQRQQPTGRCHGGSGNDTDQDADGRD